MKIPNTNKLTAKTWKIIHSSELYSEIPRCTICGKELCTSEDFDLIRRGLFHKVKSQNYLFKPVFTDDWLFFRDKCVEHAQERFPGIKINQVLKDPVIFLIGMTSDERDSIWKSRYRTASLDSFIQRHGTEQGMLLYKEYCKRQAFTNSKEYKGMTDEEFDAYNQTRASTLENFIKRHGEELGRSKWDEYCKRQSYTKSKEYLGDRYEEINRRKACTLENFKRRYGDEEGERRYRSYVTKHTGYSKMASSLFSKVDTYHSYESFYLPKNSEFSVLKERLFLYDYTIPTLNYCIEFNGDAFHANPEIFKSDDFPDFFRKNMTSAEIWERDRLKVEAIENKGFFVRVIWERDFKLNPSKVVDIILEDISEMERYNDLKN